MRELVKNKRFEAQLSRALAGSLDLDDWEDFLYQLLNHDVLPPEYDEHWLHGRFKGHLECHLSGDLLVIYRRTPKAVICKAIGTHAELFKDQPTTYRKKPKQRPKGWWSNLLGG